MALETIFQSSIIKDFILPFLLLFTLSFAILQKTKILGEGKKQLDAMVAAVIGLIFIGAVYQKEVVNNLILFLTVALVIIFVVLLLWGFVSGKAEIATDWVKWVAGIFLVIVMVIAVLWATGYSSGLFTLLFKSGWSSTFWTNFLFVVVLAAALTWVVVGDKGSKKP